MKRSITGIAMALSALTSAVANKADAQMTNNLPDPLAVVQIFNNTEAFIIGQTLADKPDSKEHFVQVVGDPMAGEFFDADKKLFTDASNLLFVGTAGHHAAVVQLQKDSDRVDAVSKQLTRADFSAYNSATTHDFRDQTNRLNRPGVIMGYVGVLGDRLDGDQSTAASYIAAGKSKSPVQYFADRMTKNWQARVHGADLTAIQSDIQNDAAAQADIDAALINAVTKGTDTVTDFRATLAKDSAISAAAETNIGRKLGIPSPVALVATPDKKPLAQNLLANGMIETAKTWSSAALGPRQYGPASRVETLIR